MTKKHYLLFCIFAFLTSTSCQNLTFSEFRTDGDSPSTESVAPPTVNSSVEEEETEETDDYSEITAILESHRTTKSKRSLEIADKVSKKNLGNQASYSQRLKKHFNFDWPVDAARFSRGFFLRSKTKRRAHYGIDLAAPKGTPILAANHGTVIYVGRAFKGYGRMIMIEAEEGWASLYAHLEKAYVKEGQIVRKGELIGGMGRTGRATGVHLHFEIRHFSDPIDPLTLLPKTVANLEGKRRPYLTALVNKKKDSSPQENSEEEVVQ